MTKRQENALVGAGMIVAVVTLIVWNIRSNKAKSSKRPAAVVIPESVGLTDTGDMAEILHSMTDNFTEFSFPEN